MAIYRNYYVNNTAQPTGEHEVHHDECAYFSSIKSKQFVGAYSTCTEAVTKARLFYTNVDGCKYCSPTCHKR